MILHLFPANSAATWRVVRRVTRVFKNFKNTPRGTIQGYSTTPTLSRRLAHHATSTSNPTLGKSGGTAASLAGEQAPPFWSDAFRKARRMAYTPDTSGSIRQLRATGHAVHACQLTSGLVILMGAHFLLGACAHLRSTVHKPGCFCVFRGDPGVVDASSQQPCFGPANLSCRLGACSEP